MKDYNEIYVYIVNYFKNKNFFNEFNIKKNSNELKITVNNGYINIKNDNFMGWHCYGNIEDLLKAQIIEYDLELFLDTINTKYYLLDNCV